uniref:Uncharacterized protein n=1 Tax=Glossina brevipalpis TaxID=37001 RepID=A0A1A9W4E6_9MUSC
MFSQCFHQHIKVMNVMAGTELTSPTRRLRSCVFLNRLHNNIITCTFKCVVSGCICFTYLVLVLLWSLLLWLPWLSNRLPQIQLYPLVRHKSVDHRNRQPLHGHHHSHRQHSRPLY